MRPTLEEILDVTLRELNISKDSFERAKKSRISSMVRARQIVSYVGHHFGYSLHAIGDFLSLTHCTIHHNKEMAKDFYYYEKGYANKVNNVLAYFENTQRVYSAKGYVARGESGDIAFFEEEPMLKNGSWRSESESMRLPEDTFPQVSVVDPPRPCEITIRFK